ncbi:MAG: hypothetical protein MUF64_22910 [Polyangiaceae bacterium]|jgi:hypothetical protein|nr:hypothetical protein [Polyangiaceae bacterium]
MKNSNYRGNAAPVLLEEDEVQGVLSGAFYTPPPEEAPASRARPTRAAAPKPEHYRVICISMYNEDLGRLDGMVEKLKARGLTKANRSALIRYALEQVDLEKVPKGIGLA